MYNSFIFSLALFFRNAFHFLLVSYMYGRFIPGPDISDELNHGVTRLICHARSTLLKSTDISQPSVNTVLILALLIYLLYCVTNDSTGINLQALYSFIFQNEETFYSVNGAELLSSACTTDYKTPEISPYKAVTARKSIFHSRKR